MRVLLVGEFSGVHTNLKVGLEDLGVQVTLANTGDGFKDFSTDMLMRIDGDSWKTRLQNDLLEIYNLYYMKKFDVIQIMHPNAFDHYDHSKVYKMLDNAGLVVQLIGGCDYAFNRYYRFLDERLCQECRMYDYRGRQCHYRQPDVVGYEKEIYKRADVIVPLSWEYHYIYKQYEKEYADKLHSVVPMPIDLKKNRMCPHQNEKIHVFHPLNREGFKGTRVFRMLFQELQREYNEIAEFSIEGKMPIAQYRKYLSHVDIVVDQLYCNTYGMNALYSMAMGKVVFSGNSTPRMFDDVEWLQDMPVLSLGYSEEEMKENIMRVVKSDKLRDIKNASRKYVETYHDTRKVARLFLKLYKQYL